MPATGLLAEAMTTLQTALETAGFRVVTDPRQVAPWCILLQLPSFVAFNGQVLEITCDFQVVAAPTNDQASWNWLLTAADSIHDSGIAVLSGEPATLVLGQQELPSYTFTVKVSTLRT